MKKYIIGIGCSWTQGEGGYPEHIWKQYNGRVNLINKPDEHLRQYEHENSWVNVLCRDYFSDYIPINLGHRGAGNRAAANQLHFIDNIDWTDSEGYVIFLLSGIDRFDFLRKEILDNVTYRWMFMVPNANDDGPFKELWNIYATKLWSDQFVANEMMLNLLNVQSFCRSKNFKLLVANAFNPYDLPLYLKTHAPTLYDKFDWSTYVHSYNEDIAMIQKLIRSDGTNIKNEDWKSNFVKYFEDYKKLDYPKMYLTNCGHPTIEGYKVIANYFSSYIT